MYNYAKTPTRGTKEIEVSIDHRIIFKGYLKKACVNENDKEQQIKAEDLSTTIAFDKQGK